MNELRIRQGTERANFMQNKVKQLNQSKFGDTEVMSSQNFLRTEDKANFEKELMKPASYNILNKNRKLIGQEANSIFKRPI